MQDRTTDRVITVDGTVRDLVQGGKVLVELDLELSATGAPLLREPTDELLAGAGGENAGRDSRDSSNGRCIWAEKSAKLTVRLIGLAPGDRVRCELSPFEPGRARIIDKL